MVGRRIYGRHASRRTRIHEARVQCVRSRERAQNLTRRTVQFRDRRASGRADPNAPVRRDEGRRPDRIADPDRGAPQRHSGQRIVGDNVAALVADVRDGPAECRTVSDDGRADIGIAERRHPKKAELGCGRRREFDVGRDARMRVVPQQLRPPNGRRRGLARRDGTVLTCLRRSEKAKQKRDECDDIARHAQTPKTKAYARTRCGLASPGKTRARMKGGTWNAPLPSSRSGQPSRYLGCGGHIRTAALGVRQ
jgi:hypothetical protein